MKVLQIGNFLPMTERGSLLPFLRGKNSLLIGTFDGATTAAVGAARKK
jgi:hypothetical protein